MQQGRGVRRLWRNGAPRAAEGAIRQPKPPRRTGAAWNLVTKWLAAKWLVDSQPTTVTEYKKRRPKLQRDRASWPALTILRPNQLDTAHASDTDTIHTPLWTFGQAVFGTGGKPFSKFVPARGIRCHTRTPCCPRKKGFGCQFTVYQCHHRHPLVCGVFPIDRTWAVDLSSLPHNEAHAGHHMGPCGVHSAKRRCHVTPTTAPASTALAQGLS